MCYCQAIAGVALYPVTFELKISPLWCPYKWHHMVHVNEQQSTRLDTLGSSSGRTVRLLLFIYSRITPMHHPNIDVAMLASWNESAAVWKWITKKINFPCAPPFPRCRAGKHNCIEELTL